jgi:hypothetical protein
MDKAKAQEVVHKDGRCLVSFLGEPSFQLRKETNMGRDHVVTRTPPAWLRPQRLGK